MPAPFEKKSLFFTVTAQNAGEGEASCTITTSAPDRGADRVISDGGKIANFLKNPVVLFGHDYRSIPVGTATEISVAANQITATWKWLTGDPFADRVRNAWEQGVLRATSIGLNPMKWSYDEERRGYDFEEWDLLEFSICPVPMNPEAVRTLSAKGIETEGLFDAPAPSSKLGAMTVTVDTAEFTKALDRLDDLLKRAASLPTTTVDIDAIELAPDPTSDVAKTVETKTTDELFIELADESPDALDIDADTFKAVVRDVFTDALREIVAATTTKALLHHSGRID